MKKNVAISPANKNVASSHALFAKSLTGNEDIIVVEFGEGKPGDIAMFAKLVSPTIAVITGIAPAHLDKYGTIQNVIKDISSVVPIVGPENVYSNSDSKHTVELTEKSITYASRSTAHYTLSDIVVHVNKTEFTCKTKRATYHIQTGIVGRHMVGAMCAGILLAEQLGVSKKAIEHSYATLVPYEHRMQPRLMNGAWIVDDTYNGNSEGVKAGLAFLAELPAKRKLYVTPGLVDQGAHTQAIHKEIGTLIAGAAPHVVVLMKNSVTPYIQAGMKEHGYAGELRIESDPLHFYTHVENFIAAGDVVLMQNDWPDNYA